VTNPICRFALFLALALSSIEVHADPSSLDSAWDGDGTVALPVGRVVTRLTGQSDGSTIAIVENSSIVASEGPNAFVVRLTPTGQVDPSFAGGAVAFACRLGSSTCAPRVSIDAQQRIWIAAVDSATQPNDIEVRRLLPNGTPDLAFGQAGTLLIRGADACTGLICPFAFDDQVSITAFPDGRASLAIECGIGPPNAVDQGTCLINVGTGGAVESIRAYPGFFQSIPVVTPAQLPNGSVILAGTAVDQKSGNRSPALLRLLANGDADTSFGSQGIAVFPIDNFFGIRQVAAFADGGALLLLRGDSPTILIRVTAAGMLDTGWISSGVFRSPNFAAFSVAAAPDGSALLAGSLSSQAAVMRLRPNGTFDSKFAGAGIATYPFQGGSSAMSIMLRNDGRITVGGLTNVGIVLLPAPKPIIPPIATPIPSPFVFQIEGGVAPVDHPWFEPYAVEYLNHPFGHYFVTANGDEMQALDLAANAPWVRTGKQFKVWGQSAPELSGVCRFWSDQSFAPKSSHFYTPYADECAFLQSGTIWRYEGNAFWLRLPEGVPGVRTCPVGSQPLYRAYNDGQGGGPNHRYTTDSAVLDAMVDQGWVVEGDGGTRVFACTAL
jgi:uncharacterized delta-60 repeat protein